MDFKQYFLLLILVGVVDKDRLCFRDLGLMHKLMFAEYIKRETNIYYLSLWEDKITLLST